ncbi:MAG: DMT family transporter [Clostridiaceae bacterium]|nr:DMT family transporter [Clostridiaceae bacterium]
MNNKKEIFFSKNINILILAIICTMLWGSAFPAVKIGYELFNIETTDLMSKILFAGYRFFLAGIITIIISSIISKKIVYPKLKELKAISILGLIQTTIQYIFFYVALANTSGVKGSIINSMGTFIAVILAHFIFKNDKLNPIKCIGCIVGFIGVFIVNYSSTGFSGNFSLAGDGLMILAAASFAIGSIISKKYAKSINSMTLTGYQLLIGGAVLIIIGVLTGSSLNFVSYESLLLLIYLATLSAVAFTLWTILLKYNSVGKITIYNFLVPVFGSSLSAIFLGESILEIKYLISLVLVCIGIYIVNKEN